MSEQLLAVLCEHRHFRSHPTFEGKAISWDSANELAPTRGHELSTCPGGHPVEGGEKDLLVSELERVLGPSWSVVLKHKRLYREVGL